MTTKGPTDPDLDWTGETLAERIHHCRMMLRMHGFLTQAESDRVKVKQMKRGMVPAGAIVVMPAQPEPPADPGPAKAKTKRKGGPNGG